MYITLEHGYRNHTDQAWKDLFGQNLHITKDYTQVPQIIADIVINNMSQVQLVTETSAPEPAIAHEKAAPEIEIPGML